MPSDQSRLVIAAFRLVGAGGNPWASTTFIDTVAYELAIVQLRDRPACGEPGAVGAVPVIGAGGV